VIHRTRPSPPTRRDTRFRLTVLYEQNIAIAIAIAIAVLFRDPVHRMKQLTRNQMFGEQTGPRPESTTEEPP